jgi:hypothetical protein
MKQARLGASLLASTRHELPFLVAFVAVFLLADIRHLHKAMTFLFIRPKGEARPNRIGIGMSVIRAVPRQCLLLHQPLGINRLGATS